MRPVEPRDVGIGGFSIASRPSTKRAIEMDRRLPSNTFAVGWTCK